MPHLNPADHATSLIATCGGDAQEALALAHMNVEFASQADDRDYWDRVAIAIQQRCAPAVKWDRASLKENWKRNAPLVTAAFLDECGHPLRVASGDPAEFAMHNRLFNVLGVRRRWLVMEEQ